jgi:ATP-binding cassette subfamily B (MDR/TAP) protein 10
MTNLVLPQVAGDIVDAISLKQGDHHMNIVIRNFLFVVVAGSITTAIRNYIFTLVGQRLVYRLRSQLYRAIVSQETAFFDESKTGELLNRLSNDTQVMQSSITQNISMFLRSLTSAVMATCIMLYISPTLGGVVLGIVPVLVCTAATYGAFVRKLSKRVMDALAKATESAEESLGNIRTVRAFSKEWSEIHKYLLRGIHMSSNSFKLPLFWGLFRHVSLGVGTSGPSTMHSSWGGRWRSLLVRLWEGSS